MRSRVERRDRAEIRENLSEGHHHSEVFKVE